MTPDEAYLSIPVECRRGIYPERGVEPTPEPPATVLQDVPHVPHAATLGVVRAIVLFACYSGTIVMLSMVLAIYILVGARQ